MSRDWLLYLDDLIASAEKIGRITGGQDAVSLAADETRFDATLFNLQVIGEAIKRIPEDAILKLSPVNRGGPARLRDLIAHHYFTIDPDIIWEVATRHVPALLIEARELRTRFDSEGSGGA